MKRLLSKKTSSAPHLTPGGSSIPSPATRSAPSTPPTLPATIEPADEPHSSTQTPRASIHHERELEEDIAPVATTQLPKRRRAWDVDIIDAHGTKKPKQLTFNDVYALPEGEKVVVHWNSQEQSIEDGGGLLNRFLGVVAKDFNQFPISYVSWKKVPYDYKTDAFKNTIQIKFDVHSDMHKNYILKSIGQKWKDRRQELWQNVDDGTKSRDQLIAMVPQGINRDNWATFVDYRLSPKTKQHAQINKDNRKKQTIPHTCGSKSIARRRAEMEVESGRQISRGEVWTATHKHSDGTFVNDEAREISSKIEEYELTSRSLSQDISTQDSLAHALGSQEHMGRVRGLGLGPAPSHVFGRSSRSYTGMSSSSTSYRNLENQVTDLKSMVENQSVQISSLMSFIMQNFQGPLPSDMPIFRHSPVPDQSSGHCPSPADHSHANSEHFEETRE